MVKIASGLLLTGIALDRSAPVPLHRQVYNALRSAILAGHLAPGERLPATRILASELGVSRNTVLDAFRQLWAEGYLEGRVGAGTYVASALPDRLLHARAGSKEPLPRTQKRPKHEAESPRLSRRGAAQTEFLERLGLLRLSDSVSPGAVGRAFIAGQPALDAFPFDLWSRLVARHARELTAKDLMYQMPGGYLPLSEAITHYLLAARGVRCTPDQVILVNGAQQAMSLAARVLLDPGDAAWVEDPGYFGARGALLGAGAEIIPVPVDDEGMNVAAGEAVCPNARLAVVTPAHQFPLGVAMSLPRRLALLEWANRHDAFIFEDDYDSEYRYAGRPLTALQGLDTQGRVLYAGTFSKVLFPSLRLGYLVVPMPLLEAFTAGRLFSDSHSSLLEQKVVADFLREGHFERHVRRMRQLYAERQELLVRAVERHLKGLVEVAPADSGMQLLGWLPPDIDDRQAAQNVAAENVITLPLSVLRAAPAGDARGALLLGYAAIPPNEIDEGARRLARALRNEV